LVPVRVHPRTSSTNVRTYPGHGTNQPTNLITTANSTGSAAKYWRLRTNPPSYVRPVPAPRQLAARGPNAVSAHKLEFPRRAVGTRVAVRAQCDPGERGREPTSREARARARARRASAPLLGRSRPRPTGRARGGGRETGPGASRAGEAALARP
jgi:hypothetical protein